MASLFVSCQHPAGDRRDPDPTRVQARLAPPADPVKVVAGQTAFVKYCALCHGAEARGYAADNAPSLVTETFLATASDAFLRVSIKEGRPGTAMAGYARALGGPLGDEDVDSMIAWLRTHGPAPVALPTAPTAGNEEQGARLYEQLCQSCHGTRNDRATAVHLANPSFLAAASDEFLRYAINRGRPGTPMVAFGQAHGGALLPGQVDDLMIFLRSWSTPPPPRPAPPRDAYDGPLVINPKGKQASFTLRENRFVPAADVKAALEAKNRIVIIDARAPSDWALSRIPGSIPGPYYQLDRLDKLPKDDTWIVAYCACPHHASGAVVDELRKRGYKRTAVLDEGILEWQKRGYPVEGTPAPAPTTSGPHAPPPPGPRPVRSAP